jgi:hypothetical protein
MAVEISPVSLSGNYYAGTGKDTLKAAAFLIEYEK